MVLFIDRPLSAELVNNNQPETCEDAKDQEQRAQGPLRARLRIFNWWFGEMRQAMASSEMGAGQAGRR